MSTRMQPARAVLRDMRSMTCEGSLELARTWLRSLTVSVIALATIAVVAACVLPLVPLWPCDLLQHFRVQYAVVGAIVVAAAAVMRVPGYFDAAAIATLLHLWWIAPDLCGEAR